jgi:hypothetical protein
MNINPKFPCTFKDGKPVLDNPGQLTEYCKKLEGKKGFVSVMPYRKCKSNLQNKYYRGVVVETIKNELGYNTNEECHAAISNHHLRYKVIKDAPPIVKSTKLSEWSALEWENYMEHLRKWALMEYGIKILLPNEVDIDSLEDVYY